MTLIEVVMVMAIIGVLSLAGSSILLFVVETGVRTPQDLSAHLAANRVVHSMIDGDGQAGGLRFSRGITTADPIQAVFVSSAGDTVSYRYDSGMQWLYRSINGGTEELWPAYEIDGMRMLAPGQRMFTYYDEDGSQTAVLADIRQVFLRVRVRISNNADPWNSNVQVRSAVTVHRF